MEKRKQETEVKSVYVLVKNDKKKFKDYVKLGFGFYIGFTTARTIKYLLLGSRNVNK